MFGNHRLAFRRGKLPSEWEGTEIVDPPADWSLKVPQASGGKQREEKQFLRSKV